jgi:hypothetical protein
MKNEKPWRYGEHSVFVNNTSCFLVRSVPPCFSSKSSQQSAKNDRKSFHQKTQKTRFVIQKGCFVTPKGRFVLVAREKGNSWFIFESLLKQLTNNKSK